MRPFAIECWEFFTYNYLLERIKLLRTRIPSSGGRNSTGQISAYKIGSFKHRKIYRFVDFWRRLERRAFVVRFDRDVFRSATLSLVIYQNGMVAYLVLPDHFKVGDSILFTQKPDGLTPEEEADRIKVIQTLRGFSIPMSVVLEGVFVYNLEIWPDKGAQICRAAGAAALVLSRLNGFVVVKLRSGWRIVVSEECYAVVGAASNAKHRHKKYTKAGHLRNIGKKPTVRGVAMNAVDHPHGGGRGKTSGGPKLRSPWGRLAKSQPTVIKKRRKFLLKIRYRYTYSK